MMFNLYLSSGGICVWGYLQPRVCVCVELVCLKLCGSVGPKAVIDGWHSWYVWKSLCTVMSVNTAGSKWQRYVTVTRVDQSHLYIRIENVVTLHRGQDGARGQNIEDHSCRGRAVHKQPFSSFHSAHAHLTPHPKSVMSPSSASTCWPFDVMEFILHTLMGALTSLQLSCCTSLLPQLPRAKSKYRNFSVTENNPAGTDRDWTQRSGRL